VQLPLRVQLQTISDFTAVRFKDVKHQEPRKIHPYILIPCAEGFLVVMITSKSRNQREYYRRIHNVRAAGCLVAVSDRDFPFLSRDSAINCNATELITGKELEERIEKQTGLEISKEAVPDRLKAEIVSAIDRSPLTAPMLKDLAKAVYPLET
jgi:hypothetical protein